MTGSRVVDRMGAQPCARAVASGGRQWTVTPQWYGPTGALWDAVDGAQVTKPAVTCDNAELSTIHRPYDDHEDTVQDREITE